MKWMVGKFEYLGYPLLLRYPHCSDIWNQKENWSRLVCLTQVLDSTSSNGLPTKRYNDLLSEFDAKMVQLFNKESEGHVVLVETFGGKRNYWYYVSDNVDVNDVVSTLVKQHPENNIDMDIKNDADWGFLENYPVQIDFKKND